MAPPYQGTGRAPPPHHRLQAPAAARTGFASVPIPSIVQLTTSPAAFGGPGPRLTSGSPTHSHRYDVAQLAIDDEAFVYTRWLRRRD